MASPSQFPDAPPNLLSIPRPSSWWSARARRRARWVIFWSLVGMLGQARRWMDLCVAAVRR